MSRTAIAFIFFILGIACGMAWCMGQERQGYPQEIVIELPAVDIERLGEDGIIARIYPKEQGVNP